MALNTGINSLNKDAPDITYTGTEGPQDPRTASAYLGDKYMGMQDLVDEFKQRHGYDPMHDMNQWFKFLEMKQQDPEARVQDRDTRTAGASDYLQYVQAMNALGQQPMPIDIFQSLEGIMSVQDMVNMGSPENKAQGGITGTYTQRRRRQMAGGGIMGSNAGSMLVAPTADGSRPGYGWNPLDWIPNEIKDPIAKLIPNELKNPVVAAVAANYLPTLLDNCLLYTSDAADE